MSFNAQENLKFLRPVFALSTLTSLHKNSQSLRTSEHLAKTWSRNCYDLNPHLFVPYPVPAEGFISGTMTGALLCSFGVLRDEFVEEEEGEEEGTPEDSRSPPFMARTEWLTLVSRLLGFGDEFSEEQKKTLCNTFLCN